MTDLREALRAAMALGLAGLFAAPAAWARTTGSSAITVAVLDTGVWQEKGPLQVSSSGRNPRVLAQYDVIAGIFFQFLTPDSRSKVFAGRPMNE